MANHRKTETSAKLKKFYSTMSNAVKLAETENGLESWEWKNIGNNCYGSNQINTFENYLAKHIIYTTIGNASEILDFSVVDKLNTYGYALGSDPVVYLNDGSYFIIAECDNSILYDVNGEKDPNDLGRDIFPFSILWRDINKNYPHFYPTVYSTSHPDGSLELGSYTREEAIQQCKTNRMLCSYLLQLDGWEFKDDYPLRL